MIKLKNYLILLSLSLVNCSTCPSTPDKIKTGENYPNCNLAGYNLKGKDLTGINFSGSNLVGADFRMTDLNQTDFRNSNLSSSNFFGASGSGYFHNANLSGAKWVKGEICLPTSIGICKVKQPKSNSSF